MTRPGSTGSRGKEMEIRDYCDDFFTIGEIAILYRHTGNSAYDFDFRRYFDCKSVVAETKSPVLLHIGAIEDYVGVCAALGDMGMKPLTSEGRHLHCSTIEEWYPALKDKTPRTRIYDTLPTIDELLEHFTFPVFIKGNRQTNRHRRSQCIIENAEAYGKLREEWAKAPVLSWQKAAIREYMLLMTLDSTSWPDMVPISYEFRFFYFEDRCVGWGPYWTVSPQYALAPEDEEEALVLTGWAAKRVGTGFVAIDVAKTAQGQWIIIEVNDAQESGLAGVNPLTLWKNTIEAAQHRTWIPVEDLIPEGAVILAGDPVPGVSTEDMREIIAGISTEQDLADAYAKVHNKFWFIEDDIYDYEPGTEDYDQVRAVVDAWGELMDTLSDRIEEIMARDHLYAATDKGNPHHSLEPFMRRYGYRDGRGWWVKGTN